MRIALANDSANELTEALLAELHKRGHEVLHFGPRSAAEPEADWPVVCGQAAEAVASGAADEAIVCCWTGTGASIVANKVPGVRAALVHDAETARGARIWNHANVLALSLRATSVPLAREILDAWFSTPTQSGEAQSDWNQRQIERLREMEQKYQRSAGPFDDNRH